MKLTDRIKQKLGSIQASPGKISWGYALGVFLGTTPFIGAKVLIALGLTTLLKWNRVASVIGVYHINVFTGPFFYGLAYAVGSRATGSETGLTLPRHMSPDWVFNTLMGSREIISALLAGGLLLGIPLSAVTGTLCYLYLRRQNRALPQHPVTSPTAVCLQNP